MDAVIKKTNYYITEYILNVKWIKTMVMPVILALIVANYLDIQGSTLSSKMTSDKIDDDGRYQLLRLYSLCFFIGYTLKYLVYIFNVQFIAVSMRSGYKNFFEEYLTIKYQSFHSIGVGEAQYNINRRAAALADFLTSLTMSFMSNAFFFMLAIHSVIYNIPGRAKISILIFIFLFLVVSLLVQLWRARIRRLVNNGFQSNSKKLYDALLNYERIVAYDNIDVECQKYWNSMQDQAHYSVYYWVTYELVEFMNNAFFVLLNVYLIKQFNDTQSLDVQSFKDFTVIFVKMREKVFEISRNIDEIFTMFTNLDQSAIEGCEIDDKCSSMAISKFDDRITIEDMSFKHADKVIFENVNMTVRKNEMVAITGVNGAGKSTFVKILLGLYDHDGLIKIDGTDINSVSKKSLRNLIGYIPQNSYLFDGSIMDNLTLANKTISPEKLTEYCKMYNTHELFKEIGYDREVGERGKNLSGGQAQKVSFMRAIIKNAPILVLDEATSNMDTVSELEVIENLKAHGINKTILMIIHNLNLLHHFDKILFFDNLTLLEQGSFEELYRVNSAFTEFYEKSISDDTN